MDGFHRYVCQNEKDACSQNGGTKVAGWYKLNVKAGESQTISVRMSEKERENPFEDCQKTFESRKKEADEFYAVVIGNELNDDEKRVSRQSYASLVWNKQFYNYVVQEWLEGDMTMPLPDDRRQEQDATDTGATSSAKTSSPARINGSTHSLVDGTPPSTAFHSARSILISPSNSSSST